MPKSTPKQKTSKPKVDGPKYPHVRVQLSGEDGNIFFILGRVRRAMRQAKIADAEIEAFSEAVNAAPSYSAALGVVFDYVSVA